MSLIEDAKNENPDAFEQLIQPQLQRMYRVAISKVAAGVPVTESIYSSIVQGSGE